MILTSLFAILIIIGMYFIIYNFKLLFDSNILTEKILVALNQTVIVYIFFQFIKIILNIYYLSDFKEKNFSPDELYNVLIESEWLFMVSIINILMYITGLIVFSFELYEKKNKQIRDVFIISSAKLLCIIAIIYNL